MKDMGYRAAVFDMDGVLLDTEKVYRLCWKKNGMSIGIPEGKMDEICDRIAGGTKSTNARVFKDVMGEDFAYLPFRQKTIDMFEQYLLDNGIDLKDGVIDTLAFLKEKGVKIALATSTDRARAENKLVKTGLFPYFDELVFGDEIERGKPYPDIYLTACKKLNVEPHNAIGVEDSVNGVISAGDAGLYTVMVIDLIKPNDITKKRANRTYDNIRKICELF